MTGGTALSGFYLRHRFSEDLDFFSEDEFDAKQLLVSVSRLGDKLKLTKIDHQNLTGQDTFFLYFDEKSFVKVDFSFFPFKHVGSYKKIGNLRISSVEDIAINKVHAITTRQRSRDYLDLYLSMRHLNWHNEDLVKNYRLKFDVSISAIQLATSFVNITDVKDLPKFLGNQDWNEVVSFFLNGAKELKEDVLST